jgi:TonB family protein
MQAPGILQSGRSKNSRREKSTMSRPREWAVAPAALCAAALCVFSVAASPQTPPEIEMLAARTAERVAKTHRDHLFVAGLEECRLAADLCGAFEASLNAKLEKMVPGAHFVKRESVVNILEGRGFIPMDVYLPDVVKAVATSAGAEILVTDTLLWQRDGYELTSEVFDVAQNKRLEQFRAKIPRPASDTSEEPLVFTDPQSKVSLIVPRDKQARSPGVVPPACISCPAVAYTPEARAGGIQGRVLLLVTVTERGTTENIGVIDGLDGGLTDQALEAVQAWRFKPAVGKDGKPFATRMPIEIPFHLQ